LAMRMVSPALDGLLTAMNSTHIARTFGGCKLVGTQVYAT